MINSFLAATRVIGADEGRYKIDYFIIHSQFNHRTYSNDVSIIKVQKSIAFSINVGPICLPFAYKNNDFTNKYLMATGT